ncbi:MAG: AI-2E family transporter [Methanomicrobiaceae archaeon]|nr:AI-2E family transporter [Methanomicrobiaceae archaeon]MDD5419499.1 AI-2E family transporter [Methanomicrobiaceae archaeon]
MPPDLPRIDLLTFLLVLGIVAAAAVAFWPLMDVVILSISLAVVIMPLQRFLSRYMNEAIAAGVVTGLVITVVVAAVFFVITVLYQNADYLAHLVETILRWFRSLQLPQQDMAFPIPSDQIADGINHQIERSIAWLEDTAARIPFLLVKMLVFFLSLYMFVYRGERIRNEIVALLPSKLNAAVERMTVVSVDTLYAIYVVHMATSVITFFLALPFFYYLGYGHILFYSLMAAIFQLIPIIGPSVLMIFLGIFALSSGDIRGLALIAIVGYPVVCAFPDIYFRPLLMGMRASIHPVIMWIGFFGGLAAMGIVGFILGPLFLALILAGYSILIAELAEIREKTKAS